MMMQTMGVAAMTLTVAAGCAPRDPVGLWQDRLSAHLGAKAGGSPVALRDLTELRSPRAQRPGQIVFGAIDIPGPGLPFFARVHDAQGVFVGEARDGDAEWYVFAVGLTARHPSGKVTLEEVRIAAFRATDRAFVWRTAEDNRRETDRYADFRWSIAGDARGRQWGDRLPVSADGAFPGVYDDFRLRVEPQGMVTIRESQSGAEWRLALRDRDRHSDTPPDYRRVSASR
jgi:hypothetical protein